MTLHLHCKHIIGQHCHIGNQTKKNWIIRLRLAAAIEDIPWQVKYFCHSTADLVRPGLPNCMWLLLCQAINNHWAQWREAWNERIHITERRMFPWAILRPVTLYSSVCGTPKWRNIDVKFTSFGNIAIWLPKWHWINVEKETSGNVDICLPKGLHINIAKMSFGNIVI